MVLRGNIETISWVEVSLGMFCFPDGWRLRLLCVQNSSLITACFLKTPLHWREPVWSITHRSLLRSSSGCVIKVFGTGGTLIFTSFEKFNQSDLTTVKYSKSSSLKKMCSCFLVTFSKDSEVIILCWFPQASLDKGSPIGFQKHWLRKVWSAKRN